MQITDLQQDFLRELMNQGAGRAAGSLNDLIDTHVNLAAPSLARTRDEARRTLEAQMERASSNPLSLIHLRFSGPLRGQATLALSRDSAARLAARLNGPPPATAGFHLTSPMPAPPPGAREAEPPELDEDALATLAEVGNIILNSVVGSAANFSGKSLAFSVPSHSQSADSLGDSGGSKPAIFTRSHFSLSNGNLPERKTTSPGASGPPATIEGDLLLSIESSSLPLLLRDVR